MEKGREPIWIEEGRRRVIGEMRTERGSNGGIEYEEDPSKVKWCVCVAQLNLEVQSRGEVSLRVHNNTEYGVWLAVAQMG